MTWAAKTCCGVIPTKGGRPQSISVADSAERVQVGSVIDVWISCSLFGGHVSWCAESDAQRRQRRRSAGGADGFGDAEVGNHGIVARYENVVWLDVAVDDAMVVGVSQRFSHIAHDAYGVAYRQLPLARELGAQRFALDEGH